MTPRRLDETLPSPRRPRNEGPSLRSAIRSRRDGINGPGITKREIEMNRGGGVGILGVIVIVVVILFLVGVIKL